VTTPDLTDRFALTVGGVYCGPRGAEVLHEEDQHDVRPGSLFTSRNNYQKL